MSTQQQALIMETILGMKRTLKRKAYDSDSDSSIDESTNRGNKLKRRARFVKQGRLASSMGPAAYKEVAEHAGYHRAIINHNPPLIDEDGYDIDSDDDEEQVQEAVTSAIEENPYASIHLEQILAPLTAVTDLPSHPMLSRPFTSTALTELIGQGRTIMQKENAALWRAKPLLTKLVGDNRWAPCGLMIAPDGSDELLFTDTTSFFNRPALAAPTLNGGRTVQESTSTQSAVRGAHLDGLGAQEAAHNNKAEGSGAEGETLPDAQVETNGEKEPEDASGAADTSKRDFGVIGNHQHAKEDKDEGAHLGECSSKPNTTGEDVEMAEASGAGASASIGDHHDAPRPTAGSTISGRGTRPPSPNPSALDEHFIHPLFRLPEAAHPDRDLSLPEQEAEEVRRLLLLYVQKQEEICRGTNKLYEGLLKADRYRQTVWQWAKAEAHCGPNRDMSDGEDWYDKEEWGLTEDLKKGEDEVEEDTTQTQKKTRNRK